MVAPNLTPLYEHVSALEAQDARLYDRLEAYVGQLEARMGALLLKEDNKVRGKIPSLDAVNQVLDALAQKVAPFYMNI